MSYCKTSAIISAPPTLIWNTCLAPMKWQEWDHNIHQLRDVSGGCSNGTTAIFEQKDGKEFAFTLHDVEEDRCVMFSGQALGGTLKAEGKIVITPIDNFSTRIEYSFELSGTIGFVVALLRKRDVVEGTEAGLRNIVKMVEKAQESEFVIMN
ncbi:hypothetical protein QTG54_006795 [Skeletonema marinoi]|uniref:Polyketide cyclase n=2 Tax=Skeletonema marinoi TaxID=267567 RepID=A0AAD9DDY2_9STRA|nr:hypothetical protein QTG54_006795 [Skeletonema marinoi]